MIKKMMPNKIGFGIVSILRKEKKRKAMAISQAFSIVLSTIAFAYILASAFPVVSAQTNQCTLTGVPVSSITNVTDWCEKNGGDAVCDTDKGDQWVLKTKTCPQTETTPTIPGNLPVSRDHSPLISAPQPSATQAPANALSSLAAIGAGPLLIGKAGAKEVAKEVAKDVPKTASKGWLAKFWNTPIGGKGSTLTVGGIFTTAAFAAAIYTGVLVFSRLFGASPELSNALAAGASGGYFVATIVYKIWGAKAATATTPAIAGLPFLAVFGIGVAVGFLIFALTFKQTRYDLYAFTCSPWDAPTGGKYCEECNKGDFPCTEYSCRSLGQACELENKGTTEELCVWKNKGDVRPPVIQPWTETLTTGYKYLPDNTISPPDRGVKIVPENNNSGCVAPFTPLRFGVMLDEAAKCKVDFSSKRDFDEMSFFFGGSSTSKYNHSQTINLPSPQALETENITLENGGEFTLYSRCQDANGNSNTANFIFRFCLDKGPDTTPPLIVTTSILNGFPVAFGQTSVDLQVFVNEPAECRWSRLDKSYENMENNMSCNTNVLEFNTQMLYQCSTNLTGLNDRTNNDFYFRCLDQPHLKGTANENDRNVNTQSYKFTLVGTQPLVIDSVKPNGTIKDSTDIIKATLEAKTSAGFNEGDSLCSFSETGDEGSFVEFFKTGTHEHSQDLFLPEGDYFYTIRCTDLGGNTDTKTTSFTVESDSEAPIVVRAFREENFLKIITNEKASCVYSTSAGNACNYLFKDGISMKSLENNKHQISWDPDRTFYIKCEDEFGNQPLPNECSIIARPFGK